MQMSAAINVRIEPSLNGKNCAANTMADCSGNPASALSPLFGIEIVILGGGSRG